MKKSILAVMVLALVVSTNVKGSMIYTKPEEGTHYTNGSEDKGSNSNTSGSSSSSTSKEESKKDDNKNNNSSSSGSGDGMTTQDRIDVSEVTSKGEKQTSSSSSTKTVVDSYNWYFSNDGELISSIPEDWISKEMKETSMNVSVTYYHAGHYIGIRYPNTHTETTVTTIEYQLIQYEYKDENGKIVPGSRSETIGSSSSTTKTKSKEDRTKEYKEEWDVPITGCDIGEECEPSTVTTPVPKLDQSEYDFDMEMTN